MASGMRNLLLVEQQISRTEVQSESQLRLFASFWRSLRGRFMHRCMCSARMQNRNFIDLYWILGKVVCVPRHASNLFHQLHARIVTLAEECVAAVQAGIRDLSNEKLRAVRVGPGIGVGEPARPVKSQIR